jgi:hypothetical protein
MDGLAKETVNQDVGPTTARDPLTKWQHQLPT